MWSSNEGILRSDVTGENIDTLINKACLKESENEFHIVDISWYKDVLYIVGNNSALYRYNVSNHQKTKLNIHSVGSVAVDWISKKLYWANPKQQIVNIIRSLFLIVVIVSLFNLKNKLTILNSIIYVLHCFYKIEGKKYLAEYSLYYEIL